MQNLELEKRTCCLTQGLREYLIIISPPAHIKNDLFDFKKDFMYRFGTARYIHSIAHISLSNFMIESIPELTILNELRYALGGKKRFEVHANGFQKFIGSNTLCIGVMGAEIIKLQNLMVAVLRKRAKIGNRGTQKIGVPHMTIASKIPDLEFDRSWAYFREKSYSKVFTVNKITVLRKNHSLGEKVYKMAFEIELE